VRSLKLYIKNYIEILVKKTEGSEKIRIFGGIEISVKMDILVTKNEITGK